MLRAWLADELCGIQHHRHRDRYMGNSARLYEGEEMTLEEMISAVERLQAIYPLLTDDQNEADQKIRWAINHLADKIWMASL